MKVAILSNVNMDYASRLLKNNLEVYEPEGYGNEIGALLNPESAYNRFNPDITFIIMDVLELLGDNLSAEDCSRTIREWFHSYSSVFEAKKGIFYISTFASLGLSAKLLDPQLLHMIGNIWNEELFNCKSRYSARIFNLGDMLAAYGAGIVANREWYLGKIRFNINGQKIIAEKIRKLCQMEARTPKKLLILDLDNTLWGGLAGENDITPVALSDSNTGLIFKECQKIIRNIARNGAMLAVVSKNNAADAMEIIERHPDMKLRKKDFVSLKINWEPKHENIKKIAEELNIGLDSFVFWDDSPGERELVKTMLPQVIVPDFPAKLEDMPGKLLEIYEEYFARGVVTSEDLHKTEQYAANSRRAELKENALTFNDYCRQLQIVIKEVDASRHVDRLEQLANKTNQFNLTTRRFKPGEFQRMLNEPGVRVFAYQVEDKFGDNGVVALVVARIDWNEKDAVIEEFVMSCRVMGRLIENAILDHIEHWLFSVGITRVYGLYYPTQKNVPVKDFYRNLGYRQTVGEDKFEKLVNPENHLQFEAVLHTLEKQVESCHERADNSGH